MLETYIKSVVLSFVERLSSFRGSQCIETIPGIGRIIFLGLCDRTVSFIEMSIILPVCPYLRVSTIRGPTVYTTSCTIIIIIV